MSENTIEEKLKAKIKSDPMFGLHKAMMFSAMKTECAIIKLIEDEERRGGEPCQSRHCVKQ